MAIPKRYEDYAKQLGLIRYGPEISALTALLKDAQQRRSDTIRGSRGAARYIQESVTAARPTIRGVYNTAVDTAAAQRAAIGAGAGSIEQAGLAARLAESQAQANTQLTQQGIGAAEGAAYARRAAESEYGRTAQQIGTRGLDLRRELGAYIASQISDQVSSAADAKAKADQLAAQLINSRGNALIGQGLMPTFDKDGNITGTTPIPGSKADPNRPGKGPKWLTPGEQITQQGRFTDALGVVRGLKGRGATRAEAVSILRSGVTARDPTPLYQEQAGGVQRRILWTPDDVKARRIDPETGRPVQPDKVGTQRMRPGRAKVDPVADPFRAAAIEIAYDGHLSKRTQDLFHALRIKIRPLGVTTYGQYERAHPLLGLSRGFGF